MRTNIPRSRRAAGADCLLASLHKNVHDSRHWHVRTGDGQAEHGGRQQLRVGDVPVLAVPIDVDRVAAAPVLRLADVVQPLPDAAAVPNLPAVSVAIYGAPEGRL